MRTGNKPKRPESTKKRVDVFCDKCGNECLQNEKTIPNHVVIWCQECNEQWIKGDGQRVSSRLLQSEAKLQLQRIADQVDSWGDMFRNANSDEFWEE